MNKSNLLLASLLLCSATACGQNGLTQSRAYRPPGQNAGPSFFESVASGIQSIIAPESSEQVGSVVIKNANILNQFNIGLNTDMKWVYKTKSLSRDLKPGETIADALTNREGAQLKDSTQESFEIVSVTGNDVTVEHISKDISDSSAKFSETNKRNTTSKNNVSEVFFPFGDREKFKKAGDKVKGEVIWTRTNQKESITVGSGSYDAEIINVKADLTDNSNPQLSLKTAQTAKIWVANGIGIVKYDTSAEISGFGPEPIKGQNVWELESFSK